MHTLSGLFHPLTKVHSLVPRSVLMSTACEVVRLTALHDVSAWPAVRMRRLAVMLSYVLWLCGAMRRVSVRLVLCDVQPQ